MDEVPRLERALRRMLWELRSYLPDLVIIGGWVPHLYRAYGGFQTWTREIPFTSELDLLVHSPLARVGDESIPEILRHAGFSRSVRIALLPRGQRIQKPTRKSSS